MSSVHRPATPSPSDTPLPPFITIDLDCSAYLEASGFRALRLSRVPGTARQVQFEFAPEAAALADDFYNEGLIPARVYAEVHRSLKARIMGVIR